MLFVTTTEMDFLYLMARGLGLMGAEGISRTFLTAAWYCPARAIDPILDRFEEGPRDLQACQTLSRALSSRAAFFATKSYLIETWKIRIEDKWKPRAAKEPSSVEMIREKVSRILGQDFPGDYTFWATDDGGIFIANDEGPLGSFRKFRITQDGQVLFTLFPNRHSGDVMRLKDAPQDRIDPSRVAEANRYLTAMNLTEKVRDRIYELRFKSFV